VRRLVIVYLGGGLGASLRAAVITLEPTRGVALPVPVLVINLVGAFCLGVIFVLADEAGLLVAETRLFLAVGVLGGFTTFSTFSWGADLLLAHGAHTATAIVYLAASMVGGLAAAQAGIIAGRELVVTLERAAIALLQRLSARGMRRIHTMRSGKDTVEAEDREDTA
jgi:CrcB protein